MTAATVDTTHPAPAQSVGAPRWRGWALPAGLALLIAGLLAGLLLGRGLNSGTADITDEVSAGFLRDMKTHHAQAVAMSKPIHERSDDADLSYLAFDIMTTQQGQIGIMTGWLDLAGQSQSASGNAMAWMGHEGPMPGMATPEQVAELDTLPVVQMEEQYLRLMIAHHRGALDMALYAQRNAAKEDVANLAAQMYAGQESEIDLMERMLAQRGATPAVQDPADAPTGHSSH